MTMHSPMPDSAQDAEKMALKKALPPAGFNLWESSAATHLGLSRDTVRTLRKDLTEGVDWCLHKNRVLISAIGWARLQARLALSQSGPQTLAAQRAAQARVEPAKSVFRVVNANFTNTRILICCAPDADPRDRRRHVRVRVRDATKFTPGMTLEATAIDAAHGLYECLRTPRWRGKW